MYAAFLLVLEAPEASKLVPGWPEERLLVADVGDGTEILSVEPLSEAGLAARLREHDPPPVHPPRAGAGAVDLQFGWEADVLAAAVDAARRRSSEPSEPAPETAPARGIPVDAEAARVAGMAAGSPVRLVAGPDGSLILVAAEERPSRPCIPWVLRDLATYGALLGAFAAGLVA